MGYKVTFTGDLESQEALSLAIDCLEASTYYMYMQVISVKGSCGNNSEEYHYMTMSA